MVSAQVVDFLKANQWSDFYQSLLTQFEQRGTLSTKQLQAIERAMAAKAPAAATYSIAPGERVEIKTWLAKRLQAESNQEFFFRNLEIVEVLGETAKAYRVRVKFVSSIAVNCHVCGRDLDNEISRATGIGPVCAVKIGLERPSLATANDTLKSIEAMCGSVGTVGPFWIPKSQIKMSV